MPYNSPHVLLPFPAGIVPGSPHLALAGVGIASPTLIPGGPPQSGNQALLSTPLSSSPGADCPTCNLVEIPYDPTLPVLKF
jgi:hypothetical protein